MAKKKKVHGAIECLYDELVSIDALKPHPKNPNKHPPEQLEQYELIMRKNRVREAVRVSNLSGFMTKGHGQVMAAQRAGWTHVPVTYQDYDSADMEIADMVADNALARQSEIDYGIVNAVAPDFAGDFDINILGIPNFGAEQQDRGPAPDAPPVIKLSDRFLIPPFSVLNAREGWWQDRKRQWLAMGIKSEMGRGDNVGDGKKKGKLGKCLETGIGAAYGREEMTGTSIFDPVMTELAYRWFCPLGGQILDPFAGGSVRGIVASKLGRKYYGVDLRQEQVEADQQQGKKLCSSPMPKWKAGDSREIGEHASGVEADFIFSCPPYADLEVYSDLAEDISTLPYGEFRKAYFEIIAETCKLLKKDRFAAFVVGEARGKDGNYYGLVPDTIRAFQEAGLQFYNEAILVTAVGSLPVRTGRSFEAGRKLGKTHQNLLVFVKGSPQKATKACGKVDVSFDLAGT